MSTLSVMSHGVMSHGVASHGVAPVPQPRLRITARGRAVLAGLVLIPSVVAALLLGGAWSAEAGSTPGTATFETVTVQPGQSLWALAETVAPQADPSEVVLEIMALNGLSAAEIQPGDRLAIPAQYTD